MQDYPLITVLVSIFGLIVAVVTLVRSRKNQKESLGYQKVAAELNIKQLNELEEKEKLKSRTELTAQIYSGNIIIENYGASIATNIQLEFIKPEDNCLITGENSKLPYPRLNPSEDFKLLATNNVKGSPSIITVIIKWENQDGTLGCYEGVLQ
jgi:hypothetical protein